jgi:hypothetical protein
MVMRALRSDTLDRTEQTNRISGRMSWSCDDPAVAPDVVGLGGIARRGWDGPADLSIKGFGEARGSVTCVFDPPAGESEVMSIRLDGDFELGTERLRLVGQGGPLVLFRFDRAGQVLGEYQLLGAALPPAAKPGLGRHRLDIALEFLPTDPSHVPMGGPGGPRRIDATLSYDCVVPAA